MTAARDEERLEEAVDDRDEEEAADEAADSEDGEGTAAALSSLPPGFTMAAA
jgi:hypothetical protein